MSVRRVTTAGQLDRWSVWFNRAMQAVGLGLVVYETAVAPTAQPVVMLVAVAMMLGNLGLRIMLKAVAEAARDVDDPEG